jgi:hypothetical protein
MSQRELAEAVNAYVFRKTERDVSLDRHDISRLERGTRRWPNPDYRAGFRAVLGVQSDAELGFCRTQRSGDEPVQAEAKRDQLPGQQGRTNGYGQHGD